MNAVQQKKAGQVRRMFADISGTYDRMNRLMTAGMDQAWRRKVIRIAGPRDGERLLDLGAGTGDLAREAFHAAPGCRVVAGDFTLAMMLAGRRRHSLPRDWGAIDALKLPFPARSFDVIVSGFLMRNVVDLDRALSEQWRVLKPGGRWVCLETTRPGRRLAAPLIRFYMRRVIPALGSLVAGQNAAYTYLPSTSEAFLPAEEFLAHIRHAGFDGAGFTRLNLGTIAIHWACKAQ